MGRLFEQIGAVSVMWAVVIDLAMGLGLFLLIHEMERRKQESTGKWMDSKKPTFS